MSKCILLAPPKSQVWQSNASFRLQRVGKLKLNWQIEIVLVRAEMKVCRADKSYQSGIKEGSSEDRRFTRFISCKIALCKSPTPRPRRWPLLLPAHPDEPGKPQASFGGDDLTASGQQLARDILSPRRRHHHQAEKD